VNEVLPAATIEQIGEGQKYTVKGKISSKKEGGRVIFPVDKVYTKELGRSNTRGHHRRRQ
jgi:hypothetical protein